VFLEVEESTKELLNPYVSQAYAYVSNLGELCTQYLCVVNMSTDFVMQSRSYRLCAQVGTVAPESDVSDSFSY